MQEIIVDPRQSTPEELAEGMRQAQTLFKLNHTMPYTDEYNALAGELFGHDVFADGGFARDGRRTSLRSPKINRRSFGNSTTSRNTTNERYY